jgi:hypothetical protein
VKRGFPASLAAAVVLIDAIMLATMGRAVVFLAAALVVAFLLSLLPIDADPRRVLPAYILALGVQVGHLVEEYVAGFYRAFPPLFGAPPWSGASFLVFNVSWLLMFALGAYGLHRRWGFAVVIALFLGIGAGVLNGVGHVALALAAGGYFPGLYTGVLALFAGSYLVWRLFRSVPVAPPAG